MAGHEATAGVRAPPPFIYLGGFLVGMLLQQLMPWPSLDPPADIGVGIVLLLLGGGLLLPSVRLWSRS